MNLASTTPRPQKKVIAAGEELKLSLPRTQKSGSPLKSETPSTLSREALSSPTLPRLASTSTSLSPGGLQAALPSGVPVSAGGAAPSGLENLLRVMDQLGPALGSPNPQVQMSGLFQLASLQGQARNTESPYAELTSSWPPAPLGSMAAALSGEAPRASDLKGEAWLRDIGRDVEGVIAQGGLSIDVNALVQQVLRESYLEQTNDLRFYAEKVKFFNETKKKIRDELNVARQVLQTVAGLEDTDELAEEFKPATIQTEYDGIVPDSNGSSPDSRTAQLLKKQAQEEAAKQAQIKALESEQNQLRAEFDALPPVSKPAIENEGGNLSQLKEAVQKSLEGLSTRERMDLERQLETSGAVAGVVTTVMVAYQKKGWRGQRRLAWREEKKVTPQTLPPKSPDQTVEQYLSTELGKLTPKGRGSSLRLTLPSFFTRPALPPRINEISQAIAALEDNALVKSEPITTKGQLTAYIDKLEEQLQSTGDDAQLANVDLQNNLQRQQQIIQQMSNMSKKISDTIMAIIRNMGG